MRKPATVNKRRKTYGKFYTTPEWREQSSFILNRDGRCILCGLTKKMAKALGLSLQAHHLDDEFYGLPIQKMKLFGGCRIITLCVNCHEVITNIKRRNYFKLNRVSPEDYVSLIPKRIEVIKINETIKSEDYRRITPLMSQWTDS